MGQFFKTVLASALGVFMAMGFLFFIMMSALIGFATSFGNSPMHLSTGLSEIKDSSTLRIVLEGELKDRVNLALYPMIWGQPPIVGLYEVIQVLQEAAKDHRIKALLIEFRSLTLGTANAESLRRAIIEFKKSGKVVAAYAEYYDEKSIYYSFSCR